MIDTRDRIPGSHVIRRWLGAGYPVSRPGLSRR